MVAYSSVNSGHCRLISLVITRNEWRVDLSEVTIGDVTQCYTRWRIYLTAVHRLCWVNGGWGGGGVKFLLSISMYVTRSLSEQWLHQLENSYWALHVLSMSFYRSITSIKARYTGIEELREIHWPLMTPQKRERPGSLAAKVRASIWTCSFSTWTAPNYLTWCA